MTHLVHESSPLNRPVLRNRMRIQIAGIALLAVGLLSGQALRAQDEAALNELLESQLPPSVEASLQDALRAIEERMTVLAGEVQQVDATLEGATRSTLTRMQEDVKKLHAKIIQPSVAKATRALTRRLP